MGCAMDIHKAGGDKSLADVVEKCLGLGFLVLVSRSKMDITHVRHMSFSTYN